MELKRFILNNLQNLDAGISTRNYFKSESAQFIKLISSLLEIDFHTYFVLLAHIRGKINKYCYAPRA